jgi:signal transduction histidine kinase
MSRRKPSLRLLAIFFLACLMQANRGLAAEPPNSSGPRLSHSASPVLTNAAQVNRLTREEAAVGQMVLIRGVITCAFPGFDAAVVQDATSGIYIDRWTAANGGIPKLGDLVEVEGITDPGQFAPRIHATRIKRVGPGELPPPVHPYWDQLINGSLDTQFVEVEGIVTTVHGARVSLITHGGKVNVLVFDENGGTNTATLESYEGALILLRACLFASWDPATHEVNVNEIRMFAPFVTVVEPAPTDPFAVTTKRVADLLLFDPQASALRRVKVSGQIVDIRNGEYYAMDGANGFRFQLKETVDLGVGDLVEVVGFPSLTGPSPVLQEAVAQKTGTAALQAAKPLEANELFRAENDAMRVRINAVLLNLSGDQRTLELQTGLQRFVARLDGQARSAGRTRAVNLPLGSLIELTGVYSGSGGNRTTGMEVSSFELLLNSVADIRVLTRPSFWTLRRLLVVVGALLGVLGLTLVWIRLLQHKVRQRTAELQREVNDREKAEQQRALAQERARIARDLHDDLGSSLTEITMLATATPGLKFPAEEATERMQSIAGKSRTLVHALDEIVWAVDPERDTLASAARYLASYAEEYLAGLKVTCRVQIPSSFPDHVISGQERHHLFLAVKESLNNAVRHGKSTEIGFRVRLFPDRMEIAISDNGAGFELEGRATGHGLVNLRERLEKLSGHCEITSAPGAGTTISLQLPLPAKAGTPSGPTANGHL